MAETRTYDQSEEVDGLSAIYLLSHEVIAQVALIATIRQYDVAEGNSSPLQVPTSLINIKSSTWPHESYQNAIEQAQRDSSIPSTK